MVRARVGARGTEQLGLGQGFTARARTRVRTRVRTRARTRVTARVRVLVRARVKAQVRICMVKARNRSVFT